jgi:hypothetical protein
MRSKVNRRGFLRVSAGVVAGLGVTEGSLQSRHAAPEAMVERLANASGAVDFPGPQPGAAVGRLSRSEAVLENDVLSMRWSLANGRITWDSFTNKLSGSKLNWAGSKIFELVLGETPLPTTKTLKASELRFAGPPELTRVAASPTAVRLAERFPGKELTIRFAPSPGGLQLVWHASLRDGSNYVRQQLDMECATDEVEVVEIALLDVPAPGAEVIGSVDGVPAVSGQTFFGYEFPLSNMKVSNGRLRGIYAYAGDLLLGARLSQSAVIGVFPAGQQRRGFLYYVERERAHPYRAFLHYNNGEDMAYYGLKRKDPEAAAKFRANQNQWFCDDIEAIGKELVQKRGVKMDSFAHDYGWDDENLVWQFHNGFPNGFADAAKMAAQFDSHLGIWLAPHGQYGVKPGIAKGWATNLYYGLAGYEPGLAWCDPRYYGRVRAAMTGMIKLYGVNYFKFDGIPNDRSDFEALIRLIRDLRALNPNIFVNPSSGTWPSPFFLLDADSTWRGGSDTGVVEKGSNGEQWIDLVGKRMFTNIGPRNKNGRITKGSPREQWLTYRDFETYSSTLGRCPLYPISSLMIHGIEFGGLRVKTYEESDMVNEIRSFFATGVDHQELFIRPELLSPHIWDVLAEAAKWSRANSEVLADTHWIGGDPSKYQVYGWASWSKRKGIISFRNPDDQAAKFELDVTRAFELPPGAPTSYTLKSPWQEDTSKPAISARAGQPVTIELAPFEVVVYDALPSN